MNELPNDTGKRGYKRRTAGYVNEISKLTGYDTKSISSVLRALELCILEEIADKSVSSDTLTDEIEVVVPVIGRLIVTKLMKGRADDIMYAIVPTDEFHENVKQAYYSGITPLDSMVEEVLVKKMVSKYKNIIKEV